jgi:hypothetical protein
METVMPIASRSGEHESRLRPFPGARPPRRGQWIAAARLPPTGFVTAGKVSNGRMRESRSSSCKISLLFQFGRLVDPLNLDQTVACIHSNPVCELLRSERRNACPLCQARLSIACNAVGNRRSNVPPSCCTCGKASFCTGRKVGRAGAVAAPASPATPLLAAALSRAASQARRAAAAAAGCARPTFRRASLDKSKPARFKLWGCQLAY